MDVVTIAGSIASIGGLGVSLAQWYTTHAKTAKLTQSRDAVDQYLEWLRRRDTADLLEAIRANQEVLDAIDGALGVMLSDDKAARSDLLIRLSSMQASLDTLPARIRDAIAGDDAHEQFESQYLEQIRRQFSSVPVAGIRELQGVQQDMSVAYVSLNMSSEEDSQSVRAEQLLHDVSLLTIRGLAGSGKTTLLSWVALQCAMRQWPWQGLVPFFIPLRVLPDESRGRPNVRDFVSYRLPEELWSVSPPRNWIANVLQSGRAVVLIDGIDELPGDFRTEFWGWLSNFVRINAGNRVYVTSRYFPDDGSRMWAPPADFSHAFVFEMPDSDVELFVQNWHDAVEPAVKEAEAIQRLRSLCSKLKVKLRDRSNSRVLELCRTPLLCSMMCALHWIDEGYLPQKRVGLYERCCSVLIDERDRKRDIRATEGAMARLTSEDTELLLQGLAFSMMRNKKSRGQQIEISREEAEDWIRPNLERCEDAISESCEPGAVIDHLVTRTGLLRVPSKGRIDFTHRSFQEYFAACAAGDENQAGDLASRAADDQWSETITLAAGTRVGGSPFANSLVRELMRRADAASSASERRRCNLLAVGCLDTGGHRLRKDLRQRIVERALSCVPPRDNAEAMMLAGAGEAIVPSLAVSSLTGSPTATVAAAAKTLVLIGGEAASDLLMGDDGFGSRRDPEVLAEVASLPGVDVMSIPALRGRKLEDIPAIVVTELRELPRPPEVRNKGITIRDWRSLADLSALNDVKEDVDSIRITGSRLLQDIAPVARFENLKVLDLSLNSILEDLSPVAGLEALTHLTLAGCSSLTDLAPLADLGRLSVVKLSGCSEIRDLAPLVELGSLKWLSVEGCNKIANLSLFKELPRVRVFDR